MKRLAAVMTLILLASVVPHGPAASTTTAQAQANPATKMTTYYVVILRRGPAWTSASTPESAAVSKAHIENIDRLTKAGTMVVAGPFVEQTGASAPAGLFILRAASLRDATTVAQNDPAVKAGRFVFEVLPWMGPETLRF